MKIEAGMKLTVRKDLTEGCYGEVDVTDEMASMAGETVEVSRVCESGKIELKGIEFYWTASMFEEFTEWIKEVLNNHLKWLKNDPAGRRANLRGADLRGANLRGAELYGANLRCADLYGAELYGANLRCADLYCADLRCAELRGADLYGADLRCAELRGAEIKDREGNEVKIEKIMSIGPIGSRNDITMVYFTTDKKALVKCGCFYDYLDKFEKAVHRTHAGNQYEKQYMALIELAKTMMEEQ